MMPRDLSPMTRRRRRILGGLALAGAAIVALAAGTRTLLPPRLHAAVERAARRALGRHLEIAGPFEVSFALSPRITARDVTLANVSWGSEPSMVRAGRVSMVLDLVSLVSGPARVRGIEIEDARLLLEADGAGNGNWRFAPSRPREPDGRPRVDIERVAIRGLELVVRARPDAAPVTVEVEDLEARLDPATRMVAIEADGRFDQAPWEIAGRLGPLEKLRDGHDIEHELAGRAGESEFEIRGRIGDLLALEAPDLEASVTGPDLGAALAHLGLRSVPTGAYRLRGRFTPAHNGVALEVEGAVGGVTVGARGAMSALTALERLDVRLEVRASDASEVGPWLGVEGLPPRPFELTGGVRHSAGQWWLDDVKVRAGPTSLEVAGPLGSAPRFVGTNLIVEVTGRDLAELSSLTGLRLPPGPFDLAGRFLCRADGLALDAAELRLGDARIRATGRLGEPPPLLDLALSIDASGPDLARFSEVARTELPPGPFALRGRVGRDGPALALDGVEGRLGDDAVRGSGRLVLEKGIEGSDFDLHVAGPDLSTLAALAGLHGVPAQPFDARGRLRVEPDGVAVDGVEASVGRLAATLAGRVGTPAARNGTALAGRVEGPALSELAAWGLAEGLPAEPFSIEGRFFIENGVARAEGIEARVGADRAGVDGVFGALPDLSLLDLAVAVSGPSLGDFGRFFGAAESAAPGRLPAESYEISGRVRRAPSGYELDGVRARAGATAVRLEGTVGAGEDLRGTDLRFDAEGPDTSLLAALAGTGLPAGPFALRGRVARTDIGFRTDGVAIVVGEARAQVAGTLGAWPGLEQTDLRIDVAGPDLAAALGPATGLARLPAQAFALSAEIAGDAERMASRRLSARLGGNDLEGRLSMRLEGSPFVDADLRSKRLHLSDLLADLGAAPSSDALPGAVARDLPSQGERLVSDEPLRLGALRKLDAKVRLEAAELEIPGLALRDVVLTGELRDGALRLDRFEGRGPHGGRARASLALEPRGDGYRLRTEGRLDGARLAVAKAPASPESHPSLDLEFDLAGEGRSLHELAASGEGHLLLVVGSGQIPHAASDRMATGVLRGLFDALTPFRKTSDRTDLQCGIAFASLTGGRAAVEPIVARTDKSTVTGRGTVDFDSEEIDFSWAVEARRGAGITGGSIAYPYIRLGGTLASPRLDLRPLEAVTSMGAAVATAGFTILSRAIADRVNAENKVCVDALAEARRPPAPHPPAALP